METVFNTRKQKETNAASLTNIVKTQINSNVDNLCKNLILYWSC